MRETPDNPAFVTLPVAAFVTNVTGEVVEVSAAWEDLTHITADGACGRTIWECLGPGLGARVREAWDACQTGTHPMEVEGDAGDDGSRRWQLEAQRAPDGRVVGIIRDITERWRRTQMQRRLLAWSRRLQQAASFGELVDLAAAEASEVTRYRSFWLFIRPSSDSPVVRRLASSGHASDAQWEHLPEIELSSDALAREVVESSHTVIVEDARTDPRTNKDKVAALGSRTIINVPLLLLDQTIGAFGMGTFNDEDVRPPTPMELEVVESMAEHVAVAAGRLRLLAERRRAERERQELELHMLRLKNLENLGVLAGGVAHDVNNLMTVVLGNLGLIHRRLEPGSVSEQNLEDALTAATRTADLASQLLAYSGQGAIQREVSDVHALASEVLTQVRSMVPKRTLLELRGAENCFISGDPEQIRQLLTNLIVNAGDAIGDGRNGEVSVTLSRTQLDRATLQDSLLDPPSPGEFVVIEVVDDGCGMDTETRSQLFDPFFSTKSVGRGLGMSAAMGVVRGHCGAFWVNSVPGEGTTMRVAIPAYTLPADTAQAPAPVEIHPERKPKASGEHKATILIAEDEDSIRKVSRRALEVAGYDVIEARDGEEALTLFDAHGDQIGVALLDSLMPGFSGTQVLQAIRAKRPGFPVVVCSGNIDRDAFGPEKPTALLPKPFMPADLVRTVEATLGTGPESEPES